MSVADDNDFTGKNAAFGRYVFFLRSIFCYVSCIQFGSMVKSGGNVRCEMRAQFTMCMCTIAQIAISVELRIAFLFSYLPHSHVWRRMHNVHSALSRWKLHTPRFRSFFFRQLFVLCERLYMLCIHQKINIYLSPTPQRNVPSFLNGKTKPLFMILM